MKEYEKALSGYLYNPNTDKDLIKKRKRCVELCFLLNHCLPTVSKEQKKLIKEIIGSIKGEYFITPPFHCDYGSNISLGNNFYSNFNLVILDGAKVTIGDNVLIGPNVTLTTCSHPLDSYGRNQGLEVAFPITIGDNVWIGANVVILGGVSIGSDSVIGAGSVVNKDIPSGVVAAGNPCRVIRKITDEDKKKYQQAPLEQ